MVEDAGPPSLSPARTTGEHLAEGPQKARINLSGCGIADLRLCQERIHICGTGPRVNQCLPDLVTPERGIPIGHVSLFAPLQIRAQNLPARSVTLHQSALILRAECRVHRPVHGPGQRHGIG